jgi:hypothetical protein
MPPKERHPDWPRPGHSAELHEWAAERDAEMDRILGDQARQAEVQLKEFVVALVDGTALSSDAESELSRLVFEVQSSAIAIASHSASPRMTDVFTGEAMNA